MASTSSSDPPRPYTGKWEYDVFLCFRGDTRYDFKSHLEKAMKAKKIRVFVDSMLEATEDNKELLGILARTAISVVIFSGKFADSSWCLDEVCTVAESIEKYGHRALPVFHKVDWTTVAGDYCHWSDCWKSAFCCSCFLPRQPLYAKTIAGLEATQQRKKEWMHSLQAVASKTGCTSESYPDDGELLGEVVARVLTTLTSMSSGIELNNLVGMPPRLAKVEQLLAMDDDQPINTVRTVGLLGMGGLGKSTLARTCYERLKRLSDRHEMKFHFVDRINETSDKKLNSVEELIPKLYSTLLSENNLTREDLDNDYRRKRLSRLKVFLVLDDVQTPPQLELLLLGKALNLTELFSPGSRIIITTRNSSVLKYVNAESYPVPELIGDEPLQLFKMHAFVQGSTIPDEFLNLSRTVMSYCEGNPLALKVLAGTLFRKDIAYWESFISSLSEPGIDNVLRRSYDELEDDDKALFLDIACFFYGTLKSLLIQYMETSYAGSYRRVEDLIGKSLLICTNDKIQGELIGVHSLLREMAWKIVNEVKNIEERSRLKDPHDIHNLLTALEGKRATQGIHLDLSKAEDMLLKPNAFKGMDSLKWLDFDWPETMGYKNKFQVLDGDRLNYLPNELRGFNWDHFPFQSLPSGFSPKKLVYLVIRHSPIGQCWKQAQPNLKNLVLLCLSSCENLKTIPKLSSCSNLEHLLLRECKTLIGLPADIEFLERLVTLDARNCRNLETVPSSLSSKFLKELLLSGCPKLTFCPEVTTSVELQALDLDFTPISRLPNSVYKVKQGGNLTLYGPNISYFPRISNSLELLCLRETAIAEIKIDHPKFDRLHLIKNAQLTALPTEIWDVVSEELIVEDSPLIGSFPVISNPESHSLTTLRVNGCKLVTEFPSCICKLKLLEVLVFVGTGISSVPSCIRDLERLSFLDLSYNISLESVPSSINELAKLSKLKLLLPPKNVDGNVVAKENNGGHGSSLPVVPRKNWRRSSQGLKLVHIPRLIGNSHVIAKLPHPGSSRLTKVGIHSSGSDQSVRLQFWSKNRKRVSSSDEDPARTKRQLRYDEDSGEYSSRKSGGSQSRRRVYTRPTERFHAYRKVPDRSRKSKLSTPKVSGGTEFETYTESEFNQKFSVEY